MDSIYLPALPSTRTRSSLQSAVRDVANSTDFGAHSMTRVGFGSRYSTVNWFGWVLVRGTPPWIDLGGFWSEVLHYEFCYNMFPMLYSPSILLQYVPYGNWVHELWSTYSTSCKVHWLEFHDYFIPCKSFACNYLISLRKINRIRAFSRSNPFWIW